MTSQKARGPGDQDLVRRSWRCSSSRFLDHPILVILFFACIYHRRIVRSPTILVNAIGLENEPMTPGRRTLSFNSVDEVMPDVERLLEGHTTVGNWSLAQICRHLATVTRRVVDLPASTPQDPSRWVGEEQKRQVLESGLLPEGLPGPPEVIPAETLGERDEAEGLRQAIAYYKASAVRDRAPPFWSAEQGRMGPAPTHSRRASPQLRDPGLRIRDKNLREVPCRTLID